MDILQINLLSSPFLFENDWFSQQDALSGIWTNVITLQASPPRYELQATNEQKHLQAKDT